MRFLLLLPLFCSGLAHGQLANQPSAPLWLSSSEAVETRFEHAGKLLKAILLVAGEGAVDVMINDAPALRVQPAATAVSVDVTKSIQPGSNLLRLSSPGERVAALLELNGDLANTRWIRTDATWKGVQQSTAIEGNVFDLKKSFDAYNSWQLAKSGAQSEATAAKDVSAPEGFAVELVRSAQGAEGSWVSMAFDPQGRITLGMEKKGLLRFEPSTKRMEQINDELLECRGLLYAHGALYANANNSKGLYRLRDTDGDDRFDERKELVHSEGGVGHGRNHIKLGPDGDVYVAHGNNVLLPTNVSPGSPLKDYANDQLLPNPWDGSMFDGNVELPAGHVLRVKPDGSEVQLIAGGLRNPLDIAFNRAGDLFTFDADMERDLGAHWYMPTRVLHVVPGADFGWRRGTGRYPAYYIDTLPSVVDIGLSSPTAIFFGYGAAFPTKYQESLFICDWSYGRIIAVHLHRRGESYGGVQETFLSGRPLNVTDGCVGPDGALWFITGGRGTQSGLYRVTGKATTEERIEKSEPVVGVDRFARHRAPADELGRWLQAVRSGDADAVIARVPSYDWSNADEATRLELLRLLAIGFVRGGKGNVLPWVESKWDDATQRVRWELTKLLIHLKSETIIERATRHLRAATSSEDLLFYPMHLRYMKQGWTLDQRRVVFDALNRAEKLNGASSYFKAIADTRAEMVAALSASDAKALAEVIVTAPAALSTHAMPAHSFKQWKLEELLPALDRVSKGRSYETAKKALSAAQCVFCHRVSASNELPAGIVGPDLTQVSARFGRKDLLMHILEPSAFIDEKFRSTIITRVDGSQVIGALESEDDERVVIKPNPLAKEVIEIAKAQIKERKVSAVSPMPPGLINVLKETEILDLLAWFETSGDPTKPAWAK